MSLLGIPGDSLALSLLVLVHIGEIPLSLLFSKPNHLSSFGLSSCDRCSDPHLCGPSLDCLHYVHVSLLPGSPALTNAPHQCQVKRRTTSLNLLIMSCLAQPRRMVAVFAARARCWLVVGLLSTKTFRSFSAKLLSSQSLG